MRRMRWIVLVLLTLMLTPAVSFSAADTSDRPAWAGSNSTEPKPGNRNDDPGDVMGEDYGDLWVVLRDSNNGAPILDENDCLQPVAADGQTLSMDLIEGSCELPAEALELVQEVEFGRISVVRSSDFVLESSFLEALNAMNAAQTITLDPAGRLFLTTEEGSKAIDSPLENIALYQQLMLNGFIPGLEKTPDNLGALAYIQRTNGQNQFTDNDLSLAAALFAAASDKAGSISLDMIVNVNTWLGLNPEESDGNRTYFDYTGFTHTPEARYGGISPMLLTGPRDMPDDDYDWFFIGPRVIENEVNFNDLPSWYVLGGATYFTKAADDALQVIEFIHNWAIPTY